MFSCTGLRFCKRTGAEHPVPASSNSSPYPDAGSLPAVNLSRPATRDGTELVNHGAGFKQIPHTNSMTSAC